MIQAVAPSLGVEVNPVNVRDAGEIERAVAAFARTSNDGLIVTGGGLRHRDLIITLAARHKLPAVYVERHNGALQYVNKRMCIVSVDRARPAWRMLCCDHQNFPSGILRKIFRHERRDLRLLSHRPAAHEA